MNNSIIVADIGGTNTRFAIAKPVSDGFDITDNWIQPSKDFFSLEDALASYLETINEKVASACLAIAGPIVKGKVHITKLGWDTSVEVMQKTFGFDNFSLINDFSALAYSLPFLREQELSVLYEGSDNGKATKMVMGPGTGFGVAGIMPVGESWQLIDGEGGFISFAPTTPLEVEILKVLMTRFDRVPVDSLLCGAGLENLYSALAVVRGVQADALTAKDITALGSSGVDPLCEAALHSFCAIMGGVAGDIALLVRPQGGIYLAGGIIPKIEDFFCASNFTSRFLAKEPMSHVVAEIPIKLLKTDNAGFIGAAAALDLGTS